jgi:protein TonB
MDFKDPNKKKALIATTLFHIVLFILFLFMGLTQPDPIPEEIGIEIAMGELGTTMDGAGEVTPANIAEPTTDVVTPDSPVATPPPTPVEAVQEAATEEDSEVAVPKSKSEKKAEKKVEEIKPVEKPQRTVNKQALYGGKKPSDASNKTGGSQGKGEGVGDRGSDEGSEDGRGALGGGKGTFELKGRSLLKEATIEDTKEEGTVVLDIWVDRFGNVIRSSPNLAESNTTSQYLFGLAKRAAIKSKYSTKNDAAIEQKGKMTFVFILQ